MVWEDKIRLARDEIQEGGKDGRRDPWEFDQIPHHCMLSGRQSKSRNNYRWLHRPMVVVRQERAKV